MAEPTTNIAGATVQQLVRQLGAVAGLYAARNMIAGGVGLGYGATLNGNNPNLTYTNESLSPTINKYNINKRVFPDDIQSTDTKHNNAILINISKNNLHTPTKTNNYIAKTTDTTIASKLDYLRQQQAAQNQGTNANIGLSQAATQIINNYNNGSLSAEDATNAMQSIMNTLGSTANQITGQLRGTKTTRIQEAILLYMPNTIVYHDQHDYAEVSLTSFLSAGLLSTAGTLQAGLGVAGRVGIDPKIEVYFRSTALRQFEFEFLLNPSTRSEAESVKNIVGTLRYHGAAEKLTTSNRVANSILWVAPSIFDITFYHNLQENTEIPRINSCVLTDIQYDPSPAGVWTTLSTGAPPLQRLRLKFKELEVNDKERIAQGF